ncbi:MAG: hypothetical protein ACJAVI_004897 [Candidatus Azotimanducaceae bacterium]|jgi:hypothetical protein
MLALDGVYTVGKSGKAKFHRVKAPNQSELRTLLNRVIQRVVRRLEKEGLLIPDPEQPWLDLGIDEPIDAVIAASTGRRTNDIESPWVPTPVAVLLRYMTHHLSEQAGLLKP